MEKHGAIQPGVTPPEQADTASVADKAGAVKTAARDRSDAIEALDSDFRKAAAEATRKSL
jgi:hypothetical protein